MGVALAVGLHAGDATWPLAFLAAGRLLVSAAQALRLRVGVACTLVWVYALVALLVSNASEGAAAAHWCARVLGGDGMCLSAARVLDGFTGVAPPHFTIGITFRYTVMRFIRWGLLGAARRCESRFLVSGAAPLLPQVPCSCAAAGAWTP